MDKVFYRRIINITEGSKDVYLIAVINGEQDIWDKEFRFYLSNDGYGSEEFFEIFSYTTYYKLWNLAKNSIDQAQKKLVIGQDFPLATIDKWGDLKVLYK